jgi:Tfp pilus assembly protein PilN
MIVVNLLPEELRPIKRTPLPHLASLLVLVLAIGAMGLLFLAKIGEISDTNAKLATAEQELDALKEIVEDYNALSAKKQQLENKINVIQEILADRIIWSEQLHELSTLTPENFWYERIRVTSKTVREERVVIDEKNRSARRRPQDQGGENH